jgi:hypothetical protein
LLPSKHKIRFAPEIPDITVKPKLKNNDVSSNLFEIAVWSNLKNLAELSGAANWASREPFAYGDPQ